MPTTASVPAPPETMAKVAETAEATRPDSTAPSWFEELLKTWSTALTRPRSSSGVAICTVVVAHDDADLVGGADQQIEGQRQVEVAREAEEHRQGAEGRDRPDQGAAGADDRWPAEQDDRHREGAGLEGGGEEAEGSRTAVEDLGRIDRQQGLGAAEDHGEEVEGHAAEEHRVAAHEGHALGDRLPAHRLAGQPRGVVAHEGQRDDCKRGEHGEGDVGRALAGEGDEAAREHGTGDVRQRLQRRGDATAAGKLAGGTMPGRRALRAGLSKAEVTPRAAEKA